jgi:uncharacterized membrane protein YphA (DoxX/SURF4 family)
MTTNSGNQKKASIALWTVQGFLALLFLFVGSMKLVTPLDVMMAQMTVPLPGWFLQFIGVCEVLGAFALVLPGLLRIWPALTPLAGAGLLIIMIGATILTAVSSTVAAALFPLVVGLLVAFVTFGRWRIAPLRASAHASGPWQSRVRGPGRPAVK